MKRKIITILSLIILACGLCAFSQNPNDGVYLMKYFDVEYNKFSGTCKLIIYKDSIAVYAVKDCRRDAGALIEKGLLIKDKSGEWIVYIKQEEFPQK